MTEFLKITHTRSELHTKDGKVEVFEEGKQSSEAIARNKSIRAELEAGFLPNLIEEVLSGEVEDVSLDQAHLDLLDGLLNSVTSEVGRALVGLTVMQLTIKTIAVNQSVRLHKGGTSRGSFSWSEGISMRTLDKNFITPILRKYNLLKLNADGFMMTRSLAENYPYTRLYKAAVRGAKAQWVEITDELESGNLHPENALKYLISILINQSESFKALVEKTLKAKDKYLAGTPESEEVLSLIYNFVEDADYGARVFEVVLHCAYQALDEMKHIDGFLKPLSQMRSANKKHGNIGDVEILESNVGMIIGEAWDAKYGKSDLREEIEEISEKLAYHPDCKLAGFITNQTPEVSEMLENRMQEVVDFHDCKIEIIHFPDWYKSIISGMSEEDIHEFNNRWLSAITESFGQKRRDQAPIDEPCEQWVEHLLSVFS